MTEKTDRIGKAFIEKSKLRTGLEIKVPNGAVCAVLKSREIHFYNKPVSIRRKGDIKYCRTLDVSHATSIRFVDYCENPFTCYYGNPIISNGRR